jgi:hypothetical protein
VVPDGTAPRGTDAGSSPAIDGTARPGPLPGTDAGALACNAPESDPCSRSIAGTWDFTPAGQAATKIEVPGGGWIKQGFTPPSATYATRITVPDSGGPQTTLLEFGAINHEATLSVDGVLVGTNMTAFTPSVFDVTKFVKPGQAHAISLVVRGRDALRSPAGRRTVPAAADWSSYVPQGIFRSAAVKVYPDVYVSDTFVRTSVRAATLTYDVWITNSGVASRQLTVSGALDSANCEPLAYPPIPSATVTVAPGATQKVTVGPVPWSLGPTSYWWPNVPYAADYRAKLHNLRVSIAEAGRPVHTRVTSGFARRSSVRRMRSTRTIT